MNEWSHRTNQSMQNQTLNRRVTFRSWRGIKRVQRRQFSALSPTRDSIATASREKHNKQQSN